MTDTDFFNQELIKNHLLFSIYDVDEFVLREVERIKSSNTIDVLDVSKASRYYFTINEVEKELISPEEYYANLKNGGTNSFFTTLNYKEFQDNFPLNDFQLQYSDDWLINYHYHETFLPFVINWIEEAGGDGDISLRIRKVLKELRRSQKALENIKYGWYKDIPLNEIQKVVIKIFKRFDEIMLKGISEYFKADFPNLFVNKKVVENRKDDKNPYPRIFIELEGFIFFEKLKEHICKKERTSLADYSFIFRQMQYDKYIYDRVSESEFRDDFLLKEYLINLDKLKTLRNCSPDTKVEIYKLLKS